jgi:hypothetical protein
MEHRVDDDQAERLKQLEVRVDLLQQAVVELSKLVALLVNPRKEQTA